MTDPALEPRLAWLLRISEFGVHIQPVLQTRGVGGWGRGKPLPLAELLRHADEWDFLLAQDRRVAALIQLTHEMQDGSALAELEGEAALPLLAGHPALYRDDRQLEPMRIEAGRVVLELNRQADQLVLQLAPQGIAARRFGIWRWTASDCLVVYTLDGELRQIADLIGHRLAVPAQASYKLLQAIRDLAPDLPMQRVDAEPDPNLPCVPADQKLYALITPLAEGLRLQMRVRPALESGWLAPGGGAERLLAEREGELCQVVRDKPAEKRLLQALRAGCPLWADWPAESGVAAEWRLNRQDAALSVLDYLQDQPEAQLACVWPEGQRQRISAADAPQLTLRVKRKGGWLEAGGELSIDDERVLQLRHLLEAITYAPGRYLRLSGEDWLLLSDSLRGKLAALAGLVDHAGPDGLAISPLALPALAGLAEDAASLELDAATQQQAARWRELGDFQPMVPTTLQASLRPYQLQGFAWMARLAHLGAGACLADDMGLGKTVQTLALLLDRAALGPQLVVAPTSVALNWLAEAARFAPSLRVRPFQQQRRLDDVGPGDLVVVSYGLLQREQQGFAEVHWASVVLDEAQAIKNAASLRAQAAFALRADFRLAASGTPVENHLGELWSLFRFVAPGLLGGEERFQQRFGQAIAEGDDNARAALKTLIQPYLLRRTKAQVLTELPPRTDITLRVPLSDAERHVYEAMRQAALDRLAEEAAQRGEAGRESGAMQVLAELTRLRRFCCHPALVQPDSALPASKFDACRKLIAEVLDNGHKLLVFSQFVDHLALLRPWLEEAGIAYQYLDGGTPASQRKAAMDAFQRGEGEVFLISLKAGGTGLNLTAADYVLHLDPWWNPAVEDQASDRAYRMGQQRPVTVYRLVAEDSIEEKIVALHAEKRALADSLLEGGDIAARLDAASLMALLSGHAPLP